MAQTLEGGLTLRRALGKAMKARCASACAMVLRHEWSRNSLNRVYETAGPLFQDVFDRFCSTTVPPVPFNWRVTFGSKSFLLPVRPQPARSWNAALAWRWSGNRSIRRLYELYLKRWPEGTLFDVGGNDGTHSYPFAAHGYRCVVFEPQPTCIEYIAETCALNGFSDVKRVCAVVTDEADREVDLWVSASTWISSRLKDHTERFEAATALRVAAVRLDAFAAEEGIAPSVMKIDVEGWEWHALAGAKEILTRHRPNLFVEILAANEHKSDIWRLLNGLGYSCTQIVHFSDSPFVPIPNLDAFLKTGGSYSDDYFFTCEPTNWLV